MAFGGALAGLSGASLSLWSTPGYVDGMTAGMGFVALGLTIWARWIPLWAIAAALLFGLLRRLPLELQGLETPLFASPSIGYFLNMLPYLAVVLALAPNSGAGSAAPAALAYPFVRGARH